MTHCFVSVTALSPLTLVVCVLTRINSNFASNSVENTTNPATPDDSPRLKFLQTACPSSTDNLTLHWHEFPPAAVTNKSTGAMEGSLALNLATAKRFCCHSINVVEKPLRVNSSADLEIMIRKDRNSDPALYFPAGYRPHQGRDAVPETLLYTVSLTWTSHYPRQARPP